MFWIACANYGLPPLKAMLGGGGELPSVSLSGMAAAVTGAPAALRASFEGFTPAVWGVVLLKSLNGILIPATFKYADNIVSRHAPPQTAAVQSFALRASFRAVLTAACLSRV